MSVMQPRGAQPFPGAAGAGGAGVGQGGVGGYPGGLQVMTPGVRAAMQQQVREHRHVARCS